VAKFIPYIPENFNNSRGESEVYESLRLLDNEYIIFHSLEWLGTGRRTLGEADFVVLHPVNGLLIIEVKSGGIEFKDGEWIQINSATGHEYKMDPFHQARKSMYELENRLKPTVGFHRMPLMAYCVWFTSIDTNKVKSFPPEAASSVILDKDDLINPEKAIKRSYTYWENKYPAKVKKDMSADFYKHRLDDILVTICPYFKVIPSLKTSAEEAERVYIRLTAQQATLLDFLEEQKIAAIHGTAGTGKTLLAVEKAKRLSEQGKNVLFLCYNSMLRNHLKDSYSSPGVIFHNIHSLAYNLLNEKQADPDAVLAEFIEYIETVYEPEDFPYQNIIIDEGQDIDNSLLKRLCSFTKTKDGSFYIFYDRNQHISLFNTQPEWIEDIECRLILQRNCRNTVEVSRTSCNIIGIDYISSFNNIRGDKPSMWVYEPCSDGLVNIVENFVTTSINGHLKPEDIVILASEKTPDWIKTGRRFYGYSLSDKYNDEGKITLTTIRKFKGLESKAVLIINTPLSKWSTQDMKRLLYVGSSRAKYLLWIAAEDDIGGDWSKIIGSYIAGRNIPTGKKGFERLYNVKVY
jgi:hypothetical protein